MRLIIANSIINAIISDYKVISAKGLTHLHLHHNYLLCIDKQGFEGLHDLKELFLDNNNLTTFDQKTFESLGLSAKFTGHNNKLICDCNIKWITGWLAVRKRISKLTKDKPSLISCASPRNLQGRSVEKLDMDDFTCHTGKFTSFLFYSKNLYP